MGRIRLQVLLEDNTWSTQYTIPKKDQCSDISTDRTLVTLNFTVEIYSTKLFFHQIDTAHVDICFSKFTIPHSAF